MSKHAAAMKVIQLENRIASINSQIRQFNALLSYLPLEQRAAKIEQIQSLAIEKEATRAEIARLLRG